MSRTLSGPPPSPPSLCGPTIVLADRTPPSPPAPQRRRPRRRLILAASALAALAAAGSIAIAVRDGDDPAAEADFDAAVALEQGVVPLVSDRVDELGTITSITVKRAADPTPADAYLLAPAGNERPRVSLVSEHEPVDLSIDGLLADGRPYEILQAEGRYISLATIGTDGQYVLLVGRAMTLVELLAVAADTPVSMASLDGVPDGWIQLGSTPMPPWIHGFSTYYRFDDGRRLAVSVERAVPGRAALAAFDETESIDLGTGGWAFRDRPPDRGLLFERGDLVVRVSGAFSDEELRTIAHSLREMSPGEHPIAQPEPYPY